MWLRARPGGRGHLEGQDAGGGGLVGEVFQGHGGQTDEVEGVAQDQAAVLRRHVQLAPLALAGRPLQRRLEQHRLLAVERLALSQRRRRQQQQGARVSTLIRLETGRKMEKLAKEKP